MAKRTAQVEVTLRDRASAGLNRLGGVAGTVSKAFGLITAAASTLTAVVGTRFLLGAVRSAGDFTEAMSRVGAVTGATTEELQRLRDAADQAGTNTRFTATEAANGLEELARAGLNANQAIEALNPSLQLAAGNNQTVAESALQITTALNAFGLSAEDAARVSDVYTRAAQRSAQTTQQLGDAMTFVAPVARAAGIDIETTAALVGRLADAGFRGSLGGTALRNAIVRLEDPSSRFRRELTKLGITSTDFVEVLGELEAAGDDAQEAIRALGVRSGPAIQTLVSGGVGPLKELQSELRNAAGASADAAAQLENNLPGALRGLQSAFDAARRALVEPLTDRLTADVQRFAGVVREFVQSEALTNLRDILVGTFDAAKRVVQQFVASIDFAEVQRKLGEFAQTVTDKLGQVNITAADASATLRRVVGATQVFFGVISTAFNAVATSISGAVVLVARAVEAQLSVLNRLTLGTSAFLRQAAEEAKLVRQDLTETFVGFAEKTNASLDSIGRGWENLTATAETSAGRINEVIEEGITEPSEEAARYLEELKDALIAGGLSAQQVGRDVGEMAEAFDEAEGDIDKATAALGRFETVTGDFGNGIETRTIPQVQRLAAEVQQAGDESADSFAGANETIDKTGTTARRAAEGVTQVGEASEKAAAAAKRWSIGLVDALNVLRETSEGAARAVDDIIKRYNFGFAGGFNGLSFLNREVRALREEIERQDAATAQWIERLQRGDEDLGRLAETAGFAVDSFNLLDSQRLDQLRGAIATARSEAERLTESAAEGVRRLEDELLRLQGREEELEERRIQRQKDEIALQLQSNSLTNEARDNLQRQLRLIDEIVRARQQQVETEARSTDLTTSRADDAERAAAAAEREARALASVDASGGRKTVELIVTVNQQGELVLSQAQLNIITERLLRALREDQARAA